MPRILSAAATFCALVLGASACGNSGTHTQDPSSVSPSTSAPSSPATASWTPPPYGPAQPAVDAYLAYNAAYNSALANPAAFNPATASKYAAGQALNVFVESIADEKRQGKAWRGTPWPSRVLVVSSNLNSAAPLVVLSDCLQPNDSWQEYVVATGQSVPTPSPPPKVPPPYPATVKMVRVSATQWVVLSFTLDGTKTCTR